MFPETVKLIWDTMPSLIGAGLRVGDMRLEGPDDRVFRGPEPSYLREIYAIIWSYKFNILGLVDLCLYPARSLLKLWSVVLRVHIISNEPVSCFSCLARTSSWVSSQANGALLPAISSDLLKVYESFTPSGIIA